MTVQTTPPALRWVVAVALFLYAAVALYQLSLDYLDTSASRATLGILLLVVASCGALLAVGVRPIRARLAHARTDKSTRTLHPTETALYAIALALAVFASPYLFVLGAVMSVVGVVAISILLLRKTLGRAVIFFLSSLAVTLVSGVVSDVLYGTGTGLEVSIAGGGEGLSVGALIALGTAVICLGIVTVLLIRKSRGVQTDFEERLFVLANNRYRRWSHEQAAERKRNEQLQTIEGERNRRNTEFDRYRRFFERASNGSKTALDWWLAYEDEETDDERPVADLLRSARERAQAGLAEIHEAEGSFAEALEQDLFGEADSLLENLRTSQENLEGEESVFPPLVAAHEEIRQLDGWENYRRELETFVRDLEDLLGSPRVKTGVANRARFPDPDQLQAPGTATARFPDPHRPSELPRMPHLRERRSGGYGCSIFTMVVLVVGFFVLIGVANGSEPGAGWAVVVFGVPVLILSALVLFVWHWAIREMDRRNEVERHRQQREEYLRELQIRDHEERGNN